MKQHRLFSLLALVLVFALALGACGLRPQTVSQPSPSPEAAATPAAEAPAVNTAEPSPVPETSATPAPEATAAPAVSPSASPEATAAAQGPGAGINPLTGENTGRDYSKLRPVAVMVENNHSQGSMINQAGVSQADILVEFQVEMITRNMAIFTDIASVPAIYPIRSARTYFVSTAMAFDAIYVHRGQSADGVDWSYKVLQNFTDNDDLDLGNDNSYRMETWPHIGEHGLATSGKLLTDSFAALGTRMEHKTENFDYGLHFTENAVPVNGETANKINICFPGSKMTDLSYDSGKNGYTAVQWNTPYVDDNNGQSVVFQNVLVIAAPTKIGQDDHYHSVITTTDVKGEGYFFNGGKAEKISWSREGLDSPYRFYDSEGKDLQLGVGHTYMAFVSSTFGGATFS